MDENEDLVTLIVQAQGGNPALDPLVAQAFGVPPAAFTESVEACMVLVRTALPEWHLHVGFGASGVLPYAALTRGTVHVEADGPTVPLAILRAALKARPL